MRQWWRKNYIRFKKGSTQFLNWLRLVMILQFTGKLFSGNRFRIILPPLFKRVSNQIKYSTNRSTAPTGAIFYGRQIHRLKYKYVFHTYINSVQNEQRSIF